MIITEANYSIADINKQLNDEQMVYDNPIQRPEGQWDNESKSLLIASILQKYPIPDIYVQIEDRDGSKARVRSILDGKQRVTIIHSFINNEFRLTPVIMDGLTIDDRIYDLGNYTFDRLDDDLKIALLSSTLRFVLVEDATDEEIEEMFNRLNNGRPLSLVQRAKSKLGINISKWLRPLFEHEFIMNRSGLSRAQMKNEDNLKVIVHLFMVLDKKYEMRSMTPKVTTGYMEELKARYPKENTYFDDIHDRILHGLDYALEATEGIPISTITKPVHLPMLILMAINANEKDYTKVAFGSWVSYFNDSIKTSVISDLYASPIREYIQYTGQGTTQKVKFEGRITEMERSMKAYMKNYGKENG